MVEVRLTLGLRSRLGLRLGLRLWLRLGLRLGVEVELGLKLRLLSLLSQVGGWGGVEKLRLELTSANLSLS